MPATPRGRGQRRADKRALDVDWLAIEVQLTQGRGQAFRDPAARVFAASPQHTFAALARGIDGAFARWDTAHLHEFELGDGTRIGPVDEDADDELLDERRVRLSRLRPGETFTYTFDLGDMWVHECMVHAKAINPTETFGALPQLPAPFLGWGSIPDQHGLDSRPGIAD